MNRKLISKAISDIDDSFITESMFPPVVRADHAPERTEKMENQKKTIHFRKITGVILAACLIFTLAVTAYATNLGGIRRTIQIWLHGDQTTAVLDIQDGQWTVRDRNGFLIRSGGGVTIDLDGTERPVTEEEIIEHLNLPDLVHKADGSDWVYYHGQTIEITEEMYDDEGFCYLELRDGDEIWYATIEKNGGMAFSPVEYILPMRITTEVNATDE